MNTNETQKSEVKTITKTFTPETWFYFQMSPDVLDVIDSETVCKIEGYKEIRVTFTMVVHS